MFNLLRLSTPILIDTDRLKGLLTDELPKSNKDCSLKVHKECEKQK